VSTVPLSAADWLGPGSLVLWASEVHKLLRR
jgi:hypothetical protein